VSAKSKFYLLSPVIVVVNMKQTFGENLSWLIEDTKITYQKLADSIGVDLATIYRWKSNQIDIGLSYLIRLCRHFECSLDFLVGKAENNVKPSVEELDNFGKRVRVVMKAKGISSYALRRNTRYTSKYFYDWDRGSDPKLSTLIELANYFDVTLDYLVGLE